MLRLSQLQNISRSFEANPVVALLGPRQCGKTTLARQYAHQLGKSGGAVHFFDLEDPTDLARLEHPKLALEGMTGLIIIDEIQRRPDLFPMLRVLVDRARKSRQFLILGSASRDLIKQSSETLAGRISYLELNPFSLGEVKSLERLWLRGGYPRSYLPGRASESIEWRKAYIATYLERDIPNLGIQIPPPALRRFWMMLTHYHGQVFNASEIGRSLGAADTTVRRYLDVLSGTFMIRQLQPWVENIGKRQVKSPKIYFRDSGIFHSLLGAVRKAELIVHPKLGASWEGFALESVIRAHRAESEEVYFWATHSQAELDLMILRDGKRLGFEFKFTDRPVLTKSMRIAMQDLKLDALTLVHPGEAAFDLADGIKAVGLGTFTS